METVGDARAVGLLHNAIAQHLLRSARPDLDASEFHVGEALRALAWSDASAVELVITRYSLAKIALLRGRLDEARRTALECLSVTEDVAPIPASWDCILLGKVAFAESDAQEARAWFDRAILLMTGVGQDRQVAEAWFEAGTLLSGIGDEAGAMEAFRSAAVAKGLPLPATLQLNIAELGA